MHLSHGVATAVRAVLVVLLAAVLLPPAGAQSPGDPGPVGMSIPTERLAGLNRFATAAAVAQATFVQPDTVYIAPGGEFAYALAGGPRAVRDGAPILLTDGDRVPAETAGELARMQPDQLVVLGGEDVVPASVAEALGAYGDVRRITGTGAVDTVARIALDGWPQGAATVYLATDGAFPDALAGGVAGAIDDAPILLTSTTHLPTATADALRALQPESVVLLGGVAAITDGVALQVGEVTDAAIGRLGGLTRIHTALDVSGAVNRSGQDVSAVYVATAGNFPDAMASAPAIALAGHALVLTNQDCLPYLVRDEIARLSPDRIVVLGGTAAVSDEAAALQTCEELPPPPTLEVVAADPLGMLEETGDSGPRPVAAMIDEEGHATPFVEDEVIVSTHDDADLARWLDDTGGEVLDTAPGVGPLAPTYVVRLPAPDTSFSQADLVRLGQDLQWVNGIATGHHVLTSDAAAGTLATATSTLAEGITIGLNFVAESGQLIDVQVEESQTAELPDGITSNNPFTWPQFEFGFRRHGTAEAWRLLAANGRDGHRVTMGIIDGGFATANGDYPTSVAGNTGAPNTTPCSGDNACPWHGTDVTVAAVGALDNQFGSVGSAGPIDARTRQYAFNGDIFSIIAEIVRLIVDNPDVINMSGGVGVDAVPAAFLRPLNDVTGFAHRHANIVMVAAAGNEGLDINRTQCVIACWERQTYIPCELDGVYCVGGLETGSSNRAPGSNYGREACENPVCGVKMFAPFTVLVGENPDNPGDQLRPVSGTSFSAPYISGVFALMMAANPNLRAYELVTLLNQTAWDSPDPQVGRVVNAYAAVRSALGPDAITLPPFNPAARRPPSPFPQDPVPAAGFSSTFSTDQGTLRGDGTTPLTAPGVRWIAGLPGTERPDLGFDGPLIAGDVLVVPADDPAAPGSNDDMSLVGIDLATGQERWTVPRIHGQCKPVVGRDGTIWAIRAFNPTATLEWSFALLAIDPATGRAETRFDTPRDANGQHGPNPLLNCARHPMRLSPDGTRLLVWQGAFYSGEGVGGEQGHSALRLFDITEQDVIETVHIRMDKTVDGGARSRFDLDSGWVRDMRVSEHRHTVYVLERDGGADLEDSFDDEWWLHAIDLADLERGGAAVAGPAQLRTPGVISRSIRLPVGSIDIAQWTVLGDEIIVTGSEGVTGRDRFPGDDGEVLSRTFRIVDDGSTLTEVSRQVGRPSADGTTGVHQDGTAILTAGDGTTLLGYTAGLGVVGIDRSTLDQRWRVPGGTSTSVSHYNLVVDAAGNGVFFSPGGDALTSVFTGAGSVRWQLPLTTGELDRYDQFRLIGVTEDGRILLSARRKDLSGGGVIALG